MVKDPVIISLALAFGLALAWVIIFTLDTSRRGLKRGWRKVKCACGFHAPSGTFVPAVGGRDVQRCLYCDVVVAEVKRSKGSLRRV